MTGPHFPDDEQPLETPAAKGRSGWTPLVARLAVVVALVLVGVAVTADEKPEPVAVDARAGWERLDVDLTTSTPVTPTEPGVRRRRAPTVPGDKSAPPPGTDQRAAKQERPPATDAIEAPDPPTREPTVARAIPEQFEATAPQSAEPAWAKTTRLTDAGFVTTDLGCAEGTSAAALDEFFRDRAGPVIGHDYQHVYPLGGDRYLWVFQDTFVDHPGVADRLDEARFAHNTAMVQDGNCFSLYHRGTASAPQSFEPGVGEEPLSRWFWPMGGELTDGTLSVFWVEMLNVDQDLGPNDGLGWYPSRTWLGTYDAETLARLDFRLAPNAGVSPIYGYAVASDDDYTYLFGNSFDQNLYRQGGYANGPHSATAMWLARTPLGDLGAAPEYRTADGWSRDPSAAIPITSRYWAENPMQPRYLGGQWVAATKVDGYWGTELAIDVANEPWGPWTTVAQGPAEPRGNDPLMLTYHAYLMPWLSDGALVVSLSQNARLMLRDAWPHPARYRMRFLPAALIEPPPSPPSTTRPPSPTTSTTRPRPTTTTRAPATTSTTTTTQPRSPTGTTSTSSTTPVTTPTTPDPPVANADTWLTPFGRPATVPVLDNDRPVAGARLLTSSLGFPADGQPAGAVVDEDERTVTVDGGVYSIVEPGKLTFTPRAGFVGTAQVTYRVTDSNRSTAVAVVSVEVADPPVANPDESTGEQGGPQMIDALANDSTSLGTGSPLESSSLVFPVHGQPDSAAVTDGGATVSVPGEGEYAIQDGVVIFTPDPAFVEPATPIAYQVSDADGVTASSTILPSVVPAAPVTEDDLVSTPFNTLVTVPVLDNDVAPDGATLLESSVVFSPDGQPAGAVVSQRGKRISVPAKGEYNIGPDGVVTFDPVYEFSGLSMPVTYQVIDSNGTSASARVTVDVGKPPVANPDTGTAQMGLPITIQVLLNDKAPDGAELDVLSVVFPDEKQDEDADVSEDGKSLIMPAEGQYTIDTEGVVTFKPDLRSEARDLTPVVYQVTDSNGNDASGSITVTVTVAE